MLAKENSVKGSISSVIEKPFVLKTKTAWMAGFITVMLFILSVFLYTFIYYDLTYYNLVLLGVTIYTLISMEISVIFRKPKKLPLNYNYKPFVSIIVPAKNEAKVIEKTVRSLFEIEYGEKDNPNYEVIIVNDDSTDETQEILERLQSEYKRLIPLKRVGGRRGKSAVLNYAVPFARGEVIAVFDADSIVEPDFLTKTVPYFLDDSVAGVQGRVRIFNADKNIITKFQDDEFSVFAHMLQVAKPFYGGIMQLAGNGQLTKKSALNEMGGWNEKSSTDDQDLTLQFLLKSKFVQYSPEAIVWQEAVTEFAPFLRQRIRWAEGMLKCVFDYLYPVILNKKLSLIQKIDGLSGLMRIVVTLLVWVGYMQLIFVTVLHILQSLSVSIPTINFICDPYLNTFCSFAFVPLFLAVMASGILKFVDKPSIKDVLRVPFYWIYNIFWLFAAPVGLYNSIVNRNTIVWDKTDHGVVNLPKQQKKSA